MIVLIVIVASICTHALEDTDGALEYNDECVEELDDAVDVARLAFLHALHGVQSDLPFSHL